MPEKHVCGHCGAEFANESAYLGHTCKTGHKPSDIEHQDALTNGRFSKISEKALERGAKRKANK